MKKVATTYGYIERRAPDKCPGCRRQNVRTRQQKHLGQHCSDCRLAFIGGYMETWTSHALGDIDPLAVQKMIHGEAVDEEYDE
jgi:ribosomal protein L37AE/L43A